MQVVGPYLQTLIKYLRIFHIYFSFHGFLLSFASVFNANSSTRKIDSNEMLHGHRVIKLYATSLSSDFVPRVVRVW